MSNYKTVSALFSLSIKDLKDKQELAHHPMDFNTGTVKQFDVLSEKAGYTGPAYDIDAMQDNIMVTSGRSNVGLSLPVNNNIGAPAMTFVYGAYPQDSLVAYSELMKVKIGPPRSSYDENALQSIVNTQLLDGIPIDTSAGNQPFNPGQLTGTSGDYNSEQYIPTAIANLPFNRVVNDYRDRIYDSYNIWDISNHINPYSTEKYQYGYGRSTPNHYLNPGYIFQISQPGSLRVNFTSYATQLELRKVAGTYYDESTMMDIVRVSPRGRWMFMGDFRQARYLLGNGAVPEPDEEATEALKSKVGLFEIVSGIESEIYRSSGGVMGGFILNIDMQSANDNLAFSGGGFPEIQVSIGGPLTVDSSGGILGAQVILSLGKPPQVIFPVRGSEGSRYFKTPRSNPANAFGDFASTPDIRYQIITAKESLSATAGIKVQVVFEALGDLGLIKVLQNGTQLIAAHVAPQMGVVARSNGFQETMPEYYTNCYCRIRGNVRILATNINGMFDISPICYKSWSPSMLMFMHVPFAISSSSVLENMVTNSSYSSTRTGTGSDVTSTGTTILPYSFPKYSYFFNDALTGLTLGTGVNIDDQNLLEDGGILGSNTRYPDAISDPRGAITAAYSIQKIDEGFGATWVGPYDITGNSPVTEASVAINSGPARTAYLGELRLGSGMAGADPLNDYAHKPLTDRELYTQPQYGGLTPYYIQYSIPCVAMWCHPYQNTQLNFAWPSINHKEWISLAKTLTGSAWYSQSASAIFPSANNSPESISSQDIEKVSVRHTLDGMILRKETTVTIRNPARDLLSMLEAQGVASGSKGYATLKIFSNQKWCIFDGFVKNYTLDEVGTGLILTVDFQDPLSYLIEKLPYGGDHIVDGWQVPDAVRYILLRLGLPIGPSVDNVGKVVTATTTTGGALGPTTTTRTIKIPRLGRFVATDVGTNSISFQSGDGALKGNLGKAMGMVPAFQYPVFYWSEQGTIEYRDAFDNSSTIMSLGYDQWRDSGLPLIRDSVSISFDTSSTTYQTVLLTKDRFRQTGVHVPVGLSHAGEYNGYKSQNTINLEGFITEKQDLQLLREQMEYQNVFISDSSIRMQYAGPPQYSKIGGAGVIRSIQIPYLPLARRAYVLTNATYDIQFEQGNYGKTTYDWKLLKPPITRIAGTLFKR